MRRSAGSWCHHLPRRPKCLLPGARKPRQGIVHGGIGAQQRDLDGSDTDASKVGDVVIGEEGAVGEDIDPGAFEAGHQSEVVDVAQEHRFSAGE